MSGVLKDVSQQKINRLMLLVQPVHLQRALGKELDQEQRRIARAAVTRSELARRE